MIDGRIVSCLNKNLHKKGILISPAVLPNIVGSVLIVPCPETLLEAFHFAFSGLLLLCTAAFV
jgi:hypothetical protein